MGFQNINQFIKITRRFTDEIVPAAAQKATAALFIAGSGMVIERTGVNTGRTRGNWQASTGSFKTNSLETVDRSGSATKGKALAVAVAAKPFSVLYLSNNVPQILVLEKGGYIPKNPPTDTESLRARRSRRNPLERKRASIIAGDEGAPLVKGGFPIQAPQGMVAVSIVELRAKADQIVRLAVPRARRR